ISQLEATDLLKAIALCFLGECNKYSPSATPCRAGLALGSSSAGVAEI
ncbi:unnamed protein product, partial [Gulo gulo]